MAEEHSLTATAGARPALFAPARAAGTGDHLALQIRATRAWLRGWGIGPTDRVALVMPDGPELVSAFLGVYSAAVCAPLNPSYTATELEFFLADLGATALVVPAEGHPAAEEAATTTGCRVLRLHPGGPAGTFHLTTAGGDVAPAAEPGEPADADALGLVLHTSGTTARPKMVGLTHRALAGSARQVAATLALGPDDVGLVVMPLFHVHGLVAGVLAPLTAGGAVHVPQGRTTDLAGTIVRSGATWLTAVPTMLQQLAGQLEGDLPGHRLRVVRSCSAPLPPAAGAALERQLGVPVVEAYGMTEGAHQIASNPLPPAARKPGSVGRATGPELAVVDDEGRAVPVGTVGEVVLRGGSVIDGYLANPTADAEAFRNGWFRTGDLGRLDEDGYLFLTGRSKELVNRGGEKIAPREVEDALSEHPAVATAVVFAVPDRRLGEQVAAAVVARGEVTERDLRLFASDRLAAFKVPRRIVFCAEIPKGPTGKLQRRGLAERLGLADLDDVPTGDSRPVDGPVEELLADLWAEVLGRPVDDARLRFLDAGGDSLTALRLLARLREDLGLTVAMVDFFDAMTIEAQAELLAAALRAS